MTRELDHYASAAARSLVLMHEEELRRFIGVWRAAVEAGVELPATKDPDYESLLTLLRHVLKSARFYVQWMADKLGHAQPEIPAPPNRDRLAERCDEYTEALLSSWRSALATVKPREMGGEAALVPWGTPFTVDSMLEHAVMHPVRHAFQLRELMDSRPEPS